MRFLFVRSEFCPLGDLLTPKIRLSSDSTSRWTPLPLAKPSHYRAASGLSPYRNVCPPGALEKGSVEEVGSSTEPLGLGYANLIVLLGCIFSLRSRPWHYRSRRRVLCTGRPMRRSCYCRRCRGNTAECRRLQSPHPEAVPSAQNEALQPTGSPV